MSESHMQNFHNDAHSVNTYLELARKSKRVLHASVNFGETHPSVSYATWEKTVLTDDQNVIDWFEEVTGKTEGQFPFLPAPALDAPDFALEHYFWEWLALENGRTNVTQEQAVTVLVTSLTENVSSDEE